MKNQQFEKLKARLMKNPKFRKAYLHPDLATAVGERIFHARVMRGWPQEKLAKKIGTKQSGIARVESGLVVPTLPMLEKIAHALKMDLQLPELVTRNRAKRPAKTTKRTKPLALPIIRPRAFA